MPNNHHEIQGVIYNKKVDKLNGKKDPTQTYLKYTLTLEVKYDDYYVYTGVDMEQHKKYKPDISTFLRFEAFNPEAVGLDVASYKEGDPVKINFIISGKDGTSKEGRPYHIDTNTIKEIRKADIGAEYPTHKGKITTEEKPVVKEKPFVPDEKPLYDEGLDDLPFILFALIGLGSLLPTIPL